MNRRHSEGSVGGGPVRRPAGHDWLRPWLAVVAVGWTALVVGSWVWSRQHEALPTDDFASFRDRVAEHARHDLLGHLGTWLVGLAGVWVAGRMARTRIREQAATVARLEAVEEELSDFYEHAPDMFVAMDVRTGVVLGCNQTLLRLLGRSREEVIGRPFGDWCAASSRERVAEALECLRGGREVRQCVLWVSGAGGERLEVELGATAVRDEAGVIVRARAVLRDGTERLKQAREIRRLTGITMTLSRVNHALLKATSAAEVLSEVCRVTVEAGQFGSAWIGRCGEGGEVTEVVAAAGSGTESMVGGLAAGDVPEKLAALISACRRARQACLGEVVLPGTTASGSVTMAAVMPLEREGKPWGVLVVSGAEGGRLEDQERAMLGEVALEVAARLDQLEQTEMRKQADAALRASEGTLRVLVDHIPQKIFLKDRESRYVFINQDYARDLGIRPEEVRGRDDREFFSSDLAEKYRADDRRVMETGEMEELEEQYFREGQRVWIRITKTPVRDAEGRVAGVCGVFRDITETKRVLEELRSREAQLAAAQRIAQLGSWQQDLLSGQLSWSEEMYRIYGVVRGEFRPSEGRSLACVVAEDRGRVSRTVEEAVAAGRPYDLEHRIVRPDGSQRYLQVTGEVAMDGEGRAVRAMGVTQDITEWKQVETVLRRRGRMLEALCFAAERFLRPGDWRESIAGVLERLAEAAEVGRAALLQVEVDGSGEVWGWYCAEWATPGVEVRGTPRPMERFALRAQGFGRWCEVLRRGEVLRGHARDFPENEQSGLALRGLRSVLAAPVMVGGRWWGFMGLSESRTERVWESVEVESLQAAAHLFGEAVERQTAEETLRRMTIQKDLVLNSAGEGIVGLDLEGRHTFVNPAAARMLGFEAGELLGTAGHALWHHSRQHGEPYPVEECPIHGAIERGTVERRNDEVFWRKDGSSFPVDYVSTPIHEAGRVVGAVLTFSDITSRKQLEAQLRQAQKMEAVGQLAGGVAHDFNNILAAVLLNLNLVQETASLDAETRQLLRDLEADAQRAANLTRQLLLFSRRSVMKVEPLDLNQVVEHLLKMLRRLIGEHVTLGWSSGEALPAVSGDTGMLEQVIMNLVVNARDAMPDGGQVMLTTCLEEVTEAAAAGNSDARPGRFVCLSVADTGCGMEDAVMRRVFEPFFSTKRTGQGTGLGLATVYGIAKQHEGWVTVESAPGKGSTFRVFLPALAEVEPSPASGEARDLGPIRRGSETILLVEDEASVRRTVSGFLRLCGYRVIEAGDGAEAIARWAEQGHEVELLFTDMVMPGGVSGLQLAEHVRSMKPGLPVVLSSGYSTELVRQQALAEKGIVFLPKPAAAQQLAAVVRRCLDERGS